MKLTHFEVQKTSLGIELRATFDNNFHCTAVLDRDMTPDAVARRLHVMAEQIQLVLPRIAQEARRPTPERDEPTSFSSVRPEDEVPR